MSVFLYRGADRMRYIDSIWNFFLSRRILVFKIIAGKDIPVCDSEVWKLRYIRRILGGCCGGLNGLDSWTGGFVTCHFPTRDLDGQISNPVWIWALFQGFQENLLMGIP